jgi:hypothetical protein
LRRLHSTSAKQSKPSPNNWHSSIVPFGHGLSHEAAELQFPVVPQKNGEAAASYVGDGIVSLGVGVASFMALVHTTLSKQSKSLPYVRQSTFQLLGQGLSHEFAVVQLVPQKNVELVGAGAGVGSGLVRIILNEVARAIAPAMSPRTTVQNGVTTLSIQ